MIKYNYNQICEMLVGSAFLSGGGGGSLKAGIRLFDHLKEETLTLYELEDLVDTKETESEYTAILAAMGTPSKIDEHDLSSVLSNAIHQMRKRCTACTPYKEITHIMPVEYGGVNTAIPIYLALTDKDFKLADADGSGRSVPSLDTTLVSLNGASITPFVMANEKNDSICVDLSEDVNATQCEEVCHDLFHANLYGSVAGVSGWPIKSSELAQYANPSSLSYAQLLGSYITKYKESKKDNPEQSVFSYLTEHMEGFEAKELASNSNGFVTTLSKAGTRLLNNGQEMGFIEIKTKSEEQTIRWEIHFINESLVLYQSSKFSMGAPIMTAPDVICLYDETDDIPLNNAYILKHYNEIENHKISLGVIPAPAKWWEGRDRKSMTDIFKKFFTSIEYTGLCLPFENIDKRL